MNLSKAYISSHLKAYPHKQLATLAVCIGGVLILSILAQLRIVLPWTPVPITGQTFGVALIALLYGSRLSLAIFSSYLGLGFIGMPIFAGGVSGMILGPTFGYLVGMLIASWCVGKLSDRGWGRRFFTALAACYVGSALIFLCGIIGLSFFMPFKSLFVAGVLPFMFGDFIKNCLAAWSVSRIK